MKQKLNAYTLEVYGKNKKPCFVVNINHIMHSGMFFFRTMKEANEFIHKEIASLESYAHLAYDENGIVDEKLERMLFEVLENPDLEIGSNGRTYSKSLFPNGID